MSSDAPTPRESRPFLPVESLSCPTPDPASLHEPERSGRVPRRGLRRRHAGFRTGPGRDSGGQRGHSCRGQSTHAGLPRESRFRSGAIAEGVASGGNAAIPFVKAGRAVLPDDLKPYWHLGATSQDVVDSADASADATPGPSGCLAGPLSTRGVAADGGSRSDADGRAHPDAAALPITFGVKVAHWALGLEQARRRLATLAEPGLPVQFGGAVGGAFWLGNPGTRCHGRPRRAPGPLGAGVAWHTDRQPIHALATAFDGAAGAVEKLALDVSLMTQTELGEVAEPPGKAWASRRPCPTSVTRCAAR